MLFNSYEFIFVFLPITFFVYFYLNHKRLTDLSKAFLIFASLFFYSYWNIKYLPIIVLSILINYLIGTRLSNPSFKVLKLQDLKIARSPGQNYQDSSNSQSIQSNTKDLTKIQSLNLSANPSLSIEASSYKLKKPLLIFGIIINLLVLGYFKYADFLIENYNLVTGGGQQLLNLTLPLAISFFTFQQIAYLVDSYKGITKEQSFLDYALFVSFFPQLIAGPIVHHKQMMPQFFLLKNKVRNYKNISLGLFMLSIGLFKKVVIADTFAVWANNGFDSSAALSLFEAWITSFSYTFELYFDFSGYADMAIGIGLLFNINLPQNFNSPYKALNIQDFWRRWHMTLSTFLRDYIYIPLGGNKKGSARTYLNLFLTFLIGGIWHGAGWTFVFWGFLHGSAIVIHRIYTKLNFKMNKILAWFITFNFVNIAWVFFRAKSFDNAVKILGEMFGLSNIVLPAFLRSKLYFLSSWGIEFGGSIANIGGDPLVCVWIVIGFVLALGFINSNEKINNFNYNYKSICLSAFCLIYGVLSLGRSSEFLYFNF